MSSTNLFSVFPPPRAPPVPRVSLPNPSNRKPSLKTVKPLDSFKESVFISLQEVPEPNTSEQEITRKLLQNATTSKGAGNGFPPPPPPQQPLKSALKKTSQEQISNSAQSSPPSGSISSSETLVRSSSEEEAKVPIRSMFPVYNPSVPLSQQSYCPQRPISAYNPSQLGTGSPQPSIRGWAGAPARDSIALRAAQAGAEDIPLSILSLQRPKYSTSKELESLWDLASSSSPIEASASFDLEVARLEEAIFTFGSSPDQSFYTVTTFDTSEIGISKTCPQRSTLQCDVSLTTIEDPSRRLPPNDGLISFIFPKLAAMLAINQSKALAEDYDLSPSDLEEIQEAALKRAANQEALQVRWNAVDKRYEIEHPAIGRKGRETNFVMSPLSPQGQAKPVIHITVATSDHSSQDQPVILVTFPSSRSASTLGEAHVVSPPISESVTETSLASLDFNTNTLHIEGNNIMEIMPSLFAIDSIVSAIASVAIADHDANAAMGKMKIWSPKLEPPNRNILEVTNASGTPTSGSFYATIAEREEAEDEARAAAKNHRKSMKSKARFIPAMEKSEVHVDLEAGRTWYGKSKVKKQRKTKQIVIGEFDLEKLTHYQSGARQGQELPAVTRGMLTVMVSSLKFVVWTMTTIVQFWCWLLVSFTRAVTSEKF